MSEDSEINEDLGVNLEEFRELAKRVRAVIDAADEPARLAKDTSWARSADMMASCVHLTWGALVSEWQAGQAAGMAGRIRGFTSLGVPLGDVPDYLYAESRPLYDRCDELAKQAMALFSRLIDDNGFTSAATQHLQELLPVVAAELSL